MKRKLIKTHFISVGESLDAVIKKYVLKTVDSGDIVVLCEKIVSLSQRRVVYKKDLRLGFWAKFLSRFVMKSPYGYSVRNPYKMQVAINEAGLLRVIFASLVGGSLKIFGIKGAFYILAGHGVSQIDGFYGEAFAEYEDMGILPCLGADRLCNDLREKYGYSFAVADINDLGGNVVGVSDDIKAKKRKILEALADNPAGQSDALTPIILLVKVSDL